MAQESEETLEVLRGMWNGKGESIAALDEACDGASKMMCRNAVHMGFEGYADTAGDVRSGWKEQLAREGKSNVKGGSLADLIAEASQEYR